jgi:NAD(P)H dehydrogenase (quinone)
MLTSTHAFTDRIAAHGNVIDAAVKAGIQHMVYMPIYRKPGSTFSMKEITEEDKYTVEKLLASGLTYTLARHPPFLEPAAMYAGLTAARDGVRVPAGNGKFTAATRDDLAAAHAAVLSGAGHENKTYYLSGSPAVSFADIAAILSEIHGKQVPYITVSDEEYVKIVNTAGLPEFIAQFVLKWVQGMNLGEWEEETQDLEALIGHKPTTPAAYLRELAAAALVQEKA